MAEIKLQCPIRSAKYFGWQHILKDLGDFKKCISQKFGENPDIYAWLGIQGHNGLDIPYADGTEVYASHDGVIEFAGADSYTNGPAGLGIVLKTQDYKTIYWHLLEFKVSPGQQVKQGQLIALGDNTGFSTSSHLHFGLKLLDSNGNVLNRDNGYDGAQDSLPFIFWPEGGVVMDKEFITDYYLSAFFRLPNDGELNYWLGKPHIEIVRATLRDRKVLLDNNQPK